MAQENYDNQAVDDSVASEIDTLAAATAEEKQTFRKGDPRQRVNLTIRTLTGERIPVSLMQTDTLLQLKELIGCVRKTPPDQQRLIYKSKELVSLVRKQQFHSMNNFLGSG